MNLHPKRVRMSSEDREYKGNAVMAKCNLLMQWNTEFKMLHLKTWPLHKMVVQRNDHTFFIDKKIIKHF